MSLRRILVRCALAGVAGLVLLCGVVFALSEDALDTRYRFPVRKLSVLSDRASREQGRQVATALAQCAHCHGSDFGGRIASDDFWLGRLWAPNLTRGRGGVGERYEVADWLRAIEHGVAPDGRALAIMPAQYLRSLGDENVSTLIAFLRDLPAVDRETPPRRFGPLARVALLSSARAELLPASSIDHRATSPAPPEPALDSSYGEFLVGIGSCRVCHHAKLSGGLHALAVEGEPEPSNLTPVGSIGSWNRTEFVSALRSGTTPDGRRLDPSYMPWPAMSQLSDLQLGAIYLYLRSLPGLATGSG